MKRRKLLGILFIFIAVLILAYALYLQFFADTKKKEVSEMSTEEVQENSQENTDMREEPQIEDNETDLEQQEEVVYPEEISELEAMPCELVGMKDEVKNQILNQSAFLNAAKNWMLTKGYYGKNILSLNEITYQYELNVRRYLLMAEGENEYFYVVEDVAKQTYTSEDLASY